MTENEIKLKVKTAKKRCVFTRKCMKEDLVGLKKIFIEHKADMVEVVPINPFQLHFEGCIESFYTLEDKKLGKEARDLFTKNFDIFTKGQEIVREIHSLATTTKRPMKFKEK